MIIVYVTCKDKEEAHKIGKHVVEKKLAACANYFPVNSVYEWQGKLQEDNEFVLLLKTFDENFDKVKEEVEKIHSYDVPCILKIDVEANKEYRDWVKQQVK
jgi:periplasmic divalent cation tolerance protein